MNREVENNGLSMTATGQNFELSCITTDNPRDTKYMDFYNVVANDTNSDAIVWKMTSASNMENYDASDDGIQPGTSGKISFVLKPMTTPLNVNIELEIVGYKGGDTLLYPTMTEIPAGNGKNIMNGHILFFEKMAAAIPPALDGGLRLQKA